MPDRPIDRHVVRKQSQQRNCTAAELSVGKINKWRDAWTVCYQYVQDWPHADVSRFHEVFQSWVPALNWVFDSPISDLSRYDVKFYYCDENPGPKEMLHLYMGENSFDQRTTVYVVFNRHEFRTILNSYCQDMTKSNRMLVDEARGTINLLSLDDSEYRGNPAEYFKTMTAWHLMFVFTLHALAHWDTYGKYDHCHYDSHLNVRDSPFYKMYFYGKIVYRRDNEE